MACKSRTQAPSVSISISYINWQREALKSSAYWTYLKLVYCISSHARRYLGAKMIIVFWKCTKHTLRGGGLWAVYAWWHFYGTQNVNMPSCNSTTATRYATFVRVHDFLHLVEKKDPVSTYFIHTTHRRKAMEHQPAPVIFPSVYVSNFS